LILFFNIKTKYSQNVIDNLLGIGVVLMENSQNIVKNQDDKVKRKTVWIFSANGKIKRCRIKKKTV